MYAYLFSVLFLISVWIITALSWDKYQTIANPLHHSQTASSVKMATIFCIFWLAGIVMSLPPFFGGNQFAFHPAMAMCSIKFSNSFGLWYSVSFLVAGTVIPLVILTYCYAHIFKIARTQSSKIAASMVKMVSIIQAPITTTPPRSISIKGKRAIGTILHIVGAFLITYIPFALVVTTEMIAQTITSDVLSAVSGTLVLSAPVINGAVYGLRNRILRESFSTFMRKKYKRLVGHDHGLDNGLIPRASSHSLARRNSSNLRLSALVKRCPNDSPTSRPLSRTQSLRTRILTAPSSPAFMQIPNGLRPPGTCIPRVNSMPIQCTVDGNFTIL
ncbi:G protein-coupled receptor 161-like [Liolophura sinensis]|uniref:G protein-coupled receptor 161-like n=1 Tax=Liolophura sinensis TaxID=3198878 RepID=UPI003158A31F